jgi:nucleoside-diphosphate-sugar epimerase
VKSGKNNCVAVIGGAGFIGRWLIRGFLESFEDSLIVVFDKADPREFDHKFEGVAGRERISFYQVDVNEESSVVCSQWSNELDLIINLAAVHREPGHAPFEYYQTNVNGAIWACELADHTSCRRIIFSSSIAVYGGSDSVVSENSEPRPGSDYGMSKYLSEKIHVNWAAQNTDRHLLILRPGVVFGSGEGGNVERLIRSSLVPVFPDVSGFSAKKSCIYVRELVNICVSWAGDCLETGGCVIFNAVFPDSPSLKQFRKAIAKVKGQRLFLIPVPFNCIYFSVLILERTLRLFPFIKSRVSAERLKKMLVNNAIETRLGRGVAYSFQWTLEDALKDYQDGGCAFKGDSYPWRP